MRSFKAVHLVLPVVFFACSAGDEGPTPEELQAVVAAAHVDSIAMALALITPESFDSITWETPQARVERGGVVFSFSCTKCHGERGAGDGGFVRQGETLVPPTFLVADWRFADDHEGLRRHIFSGTVNGMPHWGLHGIKFRDVDAVAAYINDVLRRGVS